MIHFIDKEKRGVSVVICCHNSAARLPQTLAHLAVQVTNETVDAVPWEVIIVDNCSTDRTVLVAHELWPADAPAPLRVVKESHLGLVYARMRGLAEARFALVSFIDDDNWPPLHWVVAVFALMSKHPAVGACGGQLTAVSDRPLPAWFACYADSYAVGQQALHSGDVTATRGYLWGAGLTIRKSAWEQLLAADFSPLLTGRSGSYLAAGEDQELCLALRLAGWRLWYDDCLRLQHYLPPQRLTWSYLRRLCHGFGAAFVALGIYYQILEPRSGLFRHFRQNWLFEIVGCFLLLVLQWGKLSLSPTRSLATEQACLQSEYYRGKFQSLRKQRTTYAQMVQQVHALVNKLQERQVESSKPQPLGQRKI